MPTIVIASENTVKQNATLRGFQSMFRETGWTMESANVPSGVSDQPRSEQETLEGARNRARSAARGYPHADYWVGIEGGIEDTGSMAAFAWVVIKSNTLEGKARTGTFFLPDEVAKWIRKGKELSEADDLVFNKHNSKQENGAVGLLTNNVTDRTRFYEEAVVLALIPFNNPELYSQYQG